MEDIALQNNINPPNMDGYMLQKKFEIMIDINNKKMTNELSKINNVLSSLNEEICRIKKQISGNSQVVKAQYVAPETMPQSHILYNLIGVLEELGNSIKILSEQLVLGKKKNEDIHDLLKLLTEHYGVAYS